MVSASGMSLESGQDHSKVFEESYPEHLLHVDMVPAATPKRATVDEPAMQALLMGFESLGINCEFGLLQRYFKSEPLGLLRWANVRPEKLVELLQAHFVGYGELERTKISVAPWGEILIQDLAFQTMRHSFVKSEGADIETFLRKECRRLAFLRDKLVSDLIESEKVFVYQANRIMSDVEIRSIHSAIRGYGLARLLLVQLSAPNYPAGSVEDHGGGLLIGRLDRFGITAEHSWDISFSCWQEVIERTAALA